MAKKPNVRTKEKRIKGSDGTQYIAQANYNPITGLTICRLEQRKTGFIPNSDIEKKLEEFVNLGIDGMLIKSVSEKEVVAIVPSIH